MRDSQIACHVLWDPATFDARDDPRVDLGGVLDARDADPLDGDFPDDC